MDSLLEEHEVVELKYSTRFANELRTGVRILYGVDQVLAANPILPEVDTDRERWISTADC